MFGTSRRLTSERRAQVPTGNRAPWRRCSRRCASSRARDAGGQCLDDARACSPRRGRTRLVASAPRAREPRRRRLARERPRGATPPPRRRRASRSRGFEEAEGVERRGEAERGDENLGIRGQRRRARCESTPSACGCERSSARAPGSTRLDDLSPLLNCGCVRRRHRSPSATRGRARVGAASTSPPRRSSAGSRARLFRRRGERLARRARPASAAHGRRGASRQPRRRRCRRRARRARAACRGRSNPQAIP